VHILLATADARPGRARLTVRRAQAAVPQAAVHVLDALGTYVPVADEVVHAPSDLGISSTELHRRALLLEPEQLTRWLLAGLARHVGRDGEALTLVAAGIVLLRPPELPQGTDLVLASFTAGVALDDRRHPDAEDLERTGPYAGLLVLRDTTREALDVVAEAAEHGSRRWLDVVAESLPHTVVDDPAFLLTVGSLRPGARLDTRSGALTLDGRPVTALDLAGLDPHRPWLLDARTAGDPRGRLSEHPVLADVVRRAAAEMAADDRDTATDAPDLSTTSLGVPVDAALRLVYAGAPADRFSPSVPDPYDAEQSDALRQYLTAPARGGGPGRYLRAVRDTRPDLRQAFPKVPGRDDAAFLAWAWSHAVRDGHPAELITPSLAHTVDRRALRPTSASRPARFGPGTKRSGSQNLHRPHGVNVVGFLRGELGIGESARLLILGLQAAGIPYRAVPVEQHLASRQRAVIDVTDRDALYDTTVICVNADLTPTVSASVGDIVAGTHRIGMWYWEVEDFPASQHHGLQHVDEVWTATDFVRDAIAAHSRVPVHTVTPPLPQRGPTPQLTRADLGQPDAPLFLFSFDFLSSAERKNPWGLVDAFSRAFRPGEGPVLVIKSINADLRPAEAERLRVAAARRPDVLLVERYFDAAERDALVALCDCYVSLHRSEGLGLTMAEAMAWGKPVIATGYSGNLQFMTAENSFLVPWTPTAVPDDAAPYPPGSMWAEPDLDAAAVAMRTVVDRPDEAAARGERAGADIATLHSADVAGRGIAERLAARTIAPASPRGGRTRRR